MTSVLFLIPTLGHGGAERVLVNLVNHMDLSKFDITLQTLFDEGINKQYLCSDIRYKSFMSHQFHGNSHLMKLVSPKLLYKLIVKEKYDIVISFLEGPTARIVSGCPYPESKVVSWFHTAPECDKTFRVGFSTKRAAIRAYSKMDKVVCVSKDIQESLTKMGNGRLVNTCVYYNVVESDMILQKSLERVDDFPNDTGKIRLCSTGKLQVVKGYDRLLRIHKRLLGEGYPHMLYLIGRGEEKGRLEEYIRDHHLEDSAVLLGYRDNPYKYVAACDLYVCSSRREGFSTAVTEALIVGTPVISTDCSGAHELLGDHNEYGIVVENDEESLYQAIKDFLAEPKIMKAYALKATQRGRRFSASETTKAVEDMLLEMVSI